MHRDVYVYDTRQLCVINDALLQAVTHIKQYADSVLWRYEILSGIVAATFLIEY